MSREAIEEAIEVLEDASAEMLMETGGKNYYIEAIAVLRQALVNADDTSEKRVDETAKQEQHERKKRHAAWHEGFEAGRETERAFCAAICDEKQEVFQKYYTKGLAAMCAAAIRARGET